jgi:hypothetical protein
VQALGRLILAALGLAFLVYGAVLAWRAHDATIVLTVGVLLLFFGLVLPVDWSKLALKFGSASLEVERARAAQETLASLPPDAQRQLVQPEHVAPEADEGAPALPPPAQPVADLARVREALIERLTTQPAFASHEVSGEGWIRLRLKRRTTPSEPLRQTRQPNMPPAITQAVIATGAFAVWVFALGGPFATTSWYDSIYGALVLIAFTLVIGLLNPRA